MGCDGGSDNGDDDSGDYGDVDNYGGIMWW